MTDLFKPTDDSNTTESYRDKLVGPGKKFADDEALAKGKIESDAFIETLIREKKEMRAELEARLALEDIAERTSKRTSSETNIESNHEEPPQGEQMKDNRKATQPLSKDALAQAVREALMEEKSKSSRQENMDFVTQELTKTWGPNYHTHLNSVKNELGMDEATLTELAAKSPKAFLTLVNKAPQTPMSTPPTSTRNSNIGSPVSGTVRNQAYYDQIKNTDKKTYFSIAVQSQMHRDALEQGEKFFNK